MPSHSHAAPHDSRTDHPVAKKKPISRGLLFLGEFIRSPFQTAALHESPPQVAKMMTAELGIPQAKAIVEFGPGTGPLTREIVANMPAGCRFFAIEKNPRLAAAFRQRHPDIRMYEDTVERVRELCAAEQMPPLDVVVTTIPWILFPPEFQERVLANTISCMRPGARFSMITYRHGRAKMVQRMLDICRSQFSSVDPVVAVRSRFSLAYCYRATV